MNLNNLQSNISKIETIISPLLGMRPWLVHSGLGSSIMLDFGKIYEEGMPVKYPRGEWHLWVYMCFWRIQTAHEVILSAEDVRETIDQKVKCLEGKTLESIKLSGPALETEFLFETGLLLRLFPIYTQNEKSWKLFTPNHMVLCIGPGHTWQYRRSDEPL